MNRLFWTTDLFISNFIKCGYKNLITSKSGKVFVMIKHIFNFYNVLWIYKNSGFFYLKDVRLSVCLLNWVCWLYYAVLYPYFFIFWFWKTCFEIYKIFIKMSLRLHCLVCIVLLMLILHMCFILLHNSPLRVPLVLHSSLSAINFAIPIFFFIMFAWYLCPSLHFQLLCFIPLNFCFR